MKTLVAALVLSALALCSAPTPAAKADDLKIDPDKYGAIAYSSKTQRYGYAWNHDSRYAAEKAALAEVKADDAKVLTWVQFGWVVLVIADDGAYGYDEVHGEGVTDRDALDKAKKELRKYSKAELKTAVIVCSGNVKPKVVEYK